MYAYSWDSQISVVQRDSLNLNQDITLAELGKRYIFLQNNPVEAVVVDAADRPRS